MNAAVRDSSCTLKDRGIVWLVDIMHDILPPSLCGNLQEWKHSRKQFQTWRRGTQKQLIKYNRGVPVRCTEEKIQFEGMHQVGI